MKNLLFIVALIVASSYGAPNNGRIIGGTPAQIQEHPYMVSVELDEKHFCGGFIYNEYHVVTAASCVAEYKDTPEELSVTVGASSLVFPDPFEERIFAAKVTVYDEFDATTKLHDIAVIRLERPILLRETAQLIIYQEVDPATPDAIVVGYGAIKEGGLADAKLNKAEVKIDDDACRSYGETEFDFRYMVCAGADTQGPCQYDEGSPLVQGSGDDARAVGIMSKNQGCKLVDGALEAPTIYTRLVAYYSWLRNTAGQQPAPPSGR